MSAIVQEAARHGMKVAAHAHGTQGIIAAVRAGVASIEHGSMLDDEGISLMKQRGTYLVPTWLLADIVAVPGNPLTDIRVVERATFVMKGGRIYKR